MKIKKLLKVVLVAQSYIVVEEDGEGIKIPIKQGEVYNIGDMYEREENLTEQAEDLKEKESSLETNPESNDAENPEIQKSTEEVGFPENLTTKEIESSEEIKNSENEVAELGRDI